MAFSKQLAKCSVGNFLNEDCHLLTFTRENGFKSLTEMSEEERELVRLRTMMDSIDSQFLICFHHEQSILQQYKTLQTKCCDPLHTHKKAVKGSLRPISLKAWNEYRAVGIETIPGKKLCPTCRRKLTMIRNNDSYDNDYHDDNDDTEDVSFQSFERLDGREKLNRSLDLLDVSPIKVHSIPAHSRPSYGKRKFSEAASRLDTHGKEIKEQIAKAICIPLSELSESQKYQNELEEQEEKAKDLDKLLELMKDKMKVSTKSEQIQILTLAPPSWSISKTQKEFNVSEYMVKKARSVCSAKGILGLPERKRGKTLPAETAQLIENFYCNDENSRQMPGKKDYVSIGRNVHVQKRLLLCDLKEIYASFKISNPHIKVGFSKFCQLRPKWCISVGCSGSHSVCVCTIHQNVVLMLNAIKIKKNRNELMEMLVCSLDSKECMIHRCKNCPSEDRLKEFLQKEILEDPDEFSDDCYLEIKFQQWTTVDRSQLISQCLPATDFISLLVKKLNDLTGHSYIAKAQAAYLRQRKDELRDNDAIVLLDFAENYKFVVQDEVQGFHWNQQSCTLHPVAVYYKSRGKTIQQSVCFISDDCCHDTAFVYKVVKDTISFTKKNLVCNLEHVLYFSDGCAAQYKNCKNFLNISRHKEDFDVSCTWSFFATSHGKSPCDGIGGTLKRLVSRASLQRPFQDQILSSKDVFEYCQREIQGIEVFFISCHEMGNVRHTLESRFRSAITIPGTRSYHHFQPLEGSIIGMKRVSSDTNFDLLFDVRLGRIQEEQEEIKNSDFVLCRYDENCWIGIVCDIDKEHGDFDIKFMHPSYPSRSYNWPLREDRCHVPSSHIIAPLNPPVTVTGRQYNIKDEDIRLIEEKLRQKIV